MYLEKLEIQGFKSFAQKNVLVFPGYMNGNKRRGITTIVGPNGSGKSNVADAVRWALGEQSMKTLRGKKSDDIIFSGSDKKGQLGMAEVSLYLNNEDGQVAVDYSQMVLTRRLYRDGNSEYLINDSKVRLYDIQMLLAKSNFGQKTYSVIGQGMVEGFLNTSLGERKEFFDEATGVKQYQIKRDESLNKLVHSLENLQQAEMLLTEIKPRLHSLTRQVNRLQKRDELEIELNDLQFNYYSQLWQDINDKFQEYNQQFLELEQQKRQKEKKIVLLNKDLTKLEGDRTVSREFNDLQQQLNRLQSEKDKLNIQLHKLEARLEVKLENSGNFDLSLWQTRSQELKQEVDSAQQEMEHLQTVIKDLTAKQQKLITKQTDLNQQWQGLNKELSAVREIVDRPGSGLSQQVKDIVERLDKAFQLDDLAEIKAELKLLKKELQGILQSTSDSRAQQATELQQQLLQLATDRDDLSGQLNSLGLEINSYQMRLEFLQDRQKQISSQQDQVKQKIAQVDKNVDHGSLNKDKQAVEQELNKLEEQLSKVRQQINEFNSAQENKTSQLFAKQKEVQGLQMDINQLTIKLNDLQVNAARYETRLEDLEKEIRDNYNFLKEIKEHKVKEHSDQAETHQKILKLRSQLEMIGGIDPAIAKEYEETKERHDFLSEQSTDLSQTIKSLESIIKELDLTIKEQFDKEFKHISQKFEEYFKILFSGGNAKIVKVMADQMAEEAEGTEQDNQLRKLKYLQKHNATGLAGIEIQATPPGKKIKAIAMLSGGERALVAIALICAIISANPSPFVVLDEVDAALDEANSERLAKILDDLSHKTQFIIITHNRASMRRAAVLYGITMTIEGVSKLLSVKLEDIKLQ